MQNITITDERQNNQQYGHSVYEARLGKFTGGGFTGGLLLDYFEIEETRNGIESKTSVRLVMITLGYILDF